MGLYKPPWFIYNGIDSRQMGLWVTAMPPTIRAPQRVDTIQIPARNGVLHVSDGSYDNYTRTMECAIKDRRSIDEIVAWLQGSGDIIFSTEPDKVYNIYINNQVSLAQMMLTFQKFQVQMDTYPFKYSVNAFNDTIVLTAPTTIFNKGTIYAEPVITIKGTGAITLNINSLQYKISSVNQYVTIDTPLQEVYKGTANANPLYLSDSFPRLEVGENTISWTGNISQIQIVPNWRWV